MLCRRLARSPALSLEQRSGAKKGKRKKDRDSCLVDENENEHVMWDYLASSALRDHPRADDKRPCIKKERVSAKLAHRLIRSSAPQP